ncbi:MAG: hypothetical protein IPN71_16095 [Fibrobacteres bacterium]|jgi:hypothetical protein|nr:hypothetical protein [Fibrobacterota bacterium]
MLKSFFAFFLLVMAGASLAQETGGHQQVDLNVGWSHPFGNSLEYSVDLGGGTLLGIGGGLCMAGGSYGLQVRRYFAIPGPLDPYLGMALSQVEGMDEVTFQSETGVKSDTAMYAMEGGILLAPRVGLRWSVGSVRLQLNTGWGIVLRGGGSRWLAGMRDASTDRLAKLFELGGPEGTLSGGFVF